MIFKGYGGTFSQSAVIQCKTGMLCCQQKDLGYFKLTNVLQINDDPSEVTLRKSAINRLNPCLVDQPLRDISLYKIEKSCCLAVQESYIHPQLAFPVNQKSSMALTHHPSLSSSNNLALTLIVQFIIFSHIVDVTT